MSRDIRSYFMSCGPGKKKEGTSISPPVSEKKNKPQKKRIAIIIDSDDEDVPAPIKKHKTSNEKVNSNSNDLKTGTKAARPELKPVKALDIFGCDQVKRSATKTCKEKEVEVHKKTKKKKVTLEEDRDSDLDFEATLLQLDEIEARANEQFKKESTFVVPNGCDAETSKNAQSSSHITIESKNDAKTIHILSPGTNKTVRGQEGYKANDAVSTTDSSEIIQTVVEKSTAISNVLSNVVTKLERKSNGWKGKDEGKHAMKNDSSEISTSTEKNVKISKSKRKLPGIHYSSDEDDAKNSCSKPEPKSKKNENVKETEKTPPSKKTSEDDESSWANDPAEKRRRSAIGYQRYLQRDGPKNLGLKDIPQAKPGCLKGLVFVITGVLDSIERDTAAALIQDCGGRVTASISRNTSYIVVGDDAGPSKVHKAQQLGTHQLNEDELFDLIRSKSGILTPEKKKFSPESMPKKEQKTKNVEKEKDEIDNITTKDNTPTTQDNKHKEAMTSLPVSDNKSSKKKDENFYGKSTGSANDLKQTNSPSQAFGIKTSTPQQFPPSLLWVDKYRPTSTKSIVGQQGDRSNVKKLFTWLQNWHRNQFGGKKLVKPSPWARDDDGAFFKAVLLSGPPGVGKTTTAHLVCKELGLDIVEFNASDTRSKRLLHEEVSELLSNTSLNDYFKGTNQGKTTSKHVLLMDEVDGMAGNEDRGGMQELIQLIKNSKVPILCMCNDVHHQKIRSLLGHCFDLRFMKPRVEQIRGAMQSVCFKEGVKIPPDVLTNMIIGSNQDIRQVLHHLSMYSAKETSQLDAKDSAKITKHIKLGPWDVMKKVFNAEEHKTMSINDKSDLFFHDYNISPLFVQENYLSVLPDVAKNNMFKRLDLIAQAADSICMGDTVERSIRSKNSWSLLPVQAMYSSVIPGDLLEGHMTGQINFPSWLGKNSRRNKFDRLLQELHSHTRLSISGNKQSLNLDYLPRLREAVTCPLLQKSSDGIPDAIEVLQSYHLLRTDIDSIMELSVWPGEQDPMSKVESKVKAALTRTYNKELILPYSTVMTVSKKKYVALTLEGDEGEDEVDDDDDEDDDDLSGDAMIKAKKRPAPKKEPAPVPSTGKRGRSEEAGSSAKRGRGRGKK